MKVVYRLEELPHGCRLPVATIGNFDGVHLGHQQVMRELIRRAAEIGGTPTVVTFHPHPLQVLAPNNAPRQIQTLQQKLAILESLGIQLTVVIPFDARLAQLNAREFASGILWERLRLSEIHVGPNFAFGHRREGSFRLLKEMGAEIGFLVGLVRQVQCRGSRVSSTAIRQAIVAGQVALARRLLGRPYALMGEIVRGASLGTALRFPTANLRAENELLPRTGVYVTMLTVDGRRYQSVTNVGTRPTVAAPGAVPNLAVETHVLDFGEDIYGKRVALEILLRLRNERRFSGRDALVAQIRLDVSRARRYFARLQEVAPALLAENACASS